MTMRVLKWTLDVTDQQELNIPQGAQFLCVQMQHGEPQLWALCPDGATVLPRVINIHGTGHPIDRPGAYIGTFQMHDGGLVFHVFDGGISC